MFARLPPIMTTRPSGRANRTSASLRQSRLPKLSGHRGSAGVEAGGDDQLSDWNDYVKKHGVEHARAAFRRALQMAERDKTSERSL